MPRYLLDTNIISHLARNPQGRGVEHLKTVGNDDIVVSISVACDIHFGLAKAGTGRLADNVRQILAELTVIPLEPPADDHYADIRNQLEGAGTPIGPNDLLIAAHALGLTLVTNNDAGRGLIALVCLVEPVSRCPRAAAHGSGLRSASLPGCRKFAACGCA